MQCAGDYIYKSLEIRDKGKFRNDRGETVSYDEAYILQVDEVDDRGKIHERKFKFSIENQALATKLREFAPYEKIKLYFEVNVYANGTRLNPIDVELVK